VLDVMKNFSLAWRIENIWVRCEELLSSVRERNIYADRFTNSDFIDR